MSGYELSREWFDWCFENPSKARPSHAAVYFWMIELCNRLGWKKEFRLPTLHSMEATGISSKNTYYKAFNDLVEWGFIIVIEKAKNHNTPNIISISSVSKIKSVDNSLERSALDSAIIQQEVRQGFSGGNIDKPINNKTIKNKQINNNEVSVDEVKNDFENINIIYKKFVDEVKNGGFDERIESLYMRLKLKKGTLTPLLKDFKLHIIEENRVHKNTNEFFKNFKNWLNRQDTLGKLSEYKINNNGPTSVSKLKYF